MLRIATIEAGVALQVLWKCSMVFAPSSAVPRRVFRNSLSLLSTFSKRMARCCFCDFESSENAVRTHIAKFHAALSPPKAWGRAKGRPCELCGWTHTAADETPREGWARRRKRFQRGKVAAVLGSLPSPGRFHTLGQITVPPGVTRITRISLGIESCREPFAGPPDPQGRRYCLKDRRYHFVASDSKK